MPKTAGRCAFRSNTSRKDERLSCGRRSFGWRVVLLSLAATATTSAQTSESGSNAAAEPPTIAEPSARAPGVRRTKADPAKAPKARDARNTDLGAQVSSAQFGPPPPPSEVGAAGAASGVVAPGTEQAPPSASTTSSALPLPSASAGAEPSAAPKAASEAPITHPRVFEVAEVKIRDVLVLRLKLEDGGLVPAERAKRAVRAIQAALEDTNTGSVRVESRQDRALLFVGPRPIVELTRGDAEAVGEGSLDLFAASAAAKVGDILENERRRSVVSRSALSVAFVVVLALAVLYALRMLGILARKLREFVHHNPERIPAIHLRSIEVVGPHVLRSAIVVGVGVLRLMMQFGLIFAWLLFSLSLFEATRSMTGKLTALVLTPLSGLATRFAALLPLLLLTTIGVVILVVLLRFIALFFGGVERGETELSWLRPELAAPTSLLIRIGLVVASLLVLAPLVTGNVDGSLARVGMLAVAAITLATTPLVANIVVGLVTLYGDRLKLGDEIMIGEHRGVLEATDLVELRLTTSNGRQLRVPHLVTLVRPLLIINRETTVMRRLVITAEATFEQLNELLGTAQVFTHPTTLRLVKLETTLTTLELTAKHWDAAVEQQLLVEVARELSARQIRLVLAEWQSVA